MRARCPRLTARGQAATALAVCSPHGDVCPRAAGGAVGGRRVVGSDRAGRDSVTRADDLDQRAKLGLELEVGEESLTELSSSALVGRRFGHHL